ERVLDLVGGGHAAAEDPPRVELAEGVRLAGDAVDLHLPAHGVREVGVLAAPLDDAPVGLQRRVPVAELEHALGEVPLGVPAEVGAGEGLGLDQGVERDRRALVLAHQELEHGLAVAAGGVFGADQAAALPVLPGQAVHPHHDVAHLLGDGVEAGAGVAGGGPGRQHQTQEGRDGAPSGPAEPIRGSPDRGFPRGAGSDHGDPTASELRTQLVVNSTRGRSTKERPMPLRSSTRARTEQSLPSSAMNAVLAWTFISMDRA
ncbi:MAG: hypothetical protein ACK559_40380, partial [bacterium]